jgi:hypothetical protein
VNELSVSIDALPAPSPRCIATDVMRAVALRRERVLANH